MTTKVITGLATSLDGFIAGADDSPAQPLGVGGEGLFDWFRDGDTPSRFYEWMRMSALSAEFFDSHAARVGAVITGRRTYDISGAWGGSGPLPGAPLFVMTHQVPETVPAGEPPYTFITGGIEERAGTAAAHGASPESCRGERCEPHGDHDRAAVPKGGPPGRADNLSGASRARTRRSPD